MTFEMGTACGPQIGFYRSFSEIAPLSVPSSCSGVSASIEDTIDLRT